MRFINNIMLYSANKEDVYNWKGYVKEPLLSTFTFFRQNVNSKVTHSMHILDVDSSKDENILYTVQFGLYNGKRPEPLSVRRFIIDIDSHTRATEHSEGIKDKIKNMHREIKQIFESMIDEKLREEMGKI